MAWFIAGLAGPDVIAFALPVWLPGWVGLPLSPAKPRFHLEGPDRKVSALGNVDSVELGFQVGDHLSPHSIETATPRTRGLPNPTSPLFLRD